MNENDENKADESNWDDELYSSSQRNKPIDTVDEKWKLVPAFLRLRGLVKQHIDSFNYFINVQIKDIVKANGTILSDAGANGSDDPADWFRFQFTDVRVGMPNLTENMERKDIMPHACRIRNMTYSAPISVDIEYTKGNQINIEKDVEIGRMPMMLGSSNCWLSSMNQEQLAKVKECPYDPRGYFIVKGVEKVILIQEQMAKNRIIIGMDRAAENLCAQVTSSTIKTKSLTSVVLKNGQFYLQHSLFQKNIPIIIAFKAMGIQCDQEIAQLVGSEPEFLSELGLSLQQCSQENVLTELQALEYITANLSLKAKSKINTRSGPHDVTIDILSSKILAHIPLSKNMPFQAKCRFLALMIRRIIEATNDPSKIDDKDYYGNKRLELAGQMVSLLFEDQFKTFVLTLKTAIEKELPRYANAKRVVEPFDARTKIRSDQLTHGLERTISTGNWTLKRFGMNAQGITQPLSRQSYISTLGMMTRVNSQFEKTRKISGPRALQPSHWGMLCPSDTPEGESCGLVKNLALTTHVTSDSPDAPLRRLAFDLGMEDASLVSGDELHSPKNTLVFLNGQPIGVVRHAEKFVRNFRHLRKKGRIQEFVSIYKNEPHNCIYIASDGGRLVRPLLVVTKGKLILKQKHIDDLTLGLKEFSDFIREGVIEYQDVNEENNTLIALRERDITADTTHMEIDPFTILGIVSGLIPYPHHNQSPRNTYQCAMGKQAIGSIGYNQLQRVDTILDLMYYPQKPMVKSKTLEISNFENLPAGQNASVAIMSYTGYDIEDAVILNRASLDRGFGRAMQMRRYQTNLNKYANGLEDTLHKPPRIPAPTDDAYWKAKPYHGIDRDGLARIGEKLDEHDVYVNKYIPEDPKHRVVQVTSYTGSVERVDRATAKMKQDSIKFKGLRNPAYVDRMILTSNKEEYCLIKMITRQTRIPEIGDKFSSRHGQKGVVGLIVPQVDMPFSERNGWCPDLVMNPHGFPSRMTVGKMIELISGKAGLLEGEQKYGTAFGGDNVEEMGRVLVKHGYSFDGKDMLMSGITGEMLPCYVFSGPIFYQRLKHMVQDKMHARARGVVSTLTRQPLEGRAKDGGLRVGEMERDALIGYGASALILERLMLSSDAFEVYICNVCGFIGYEGNCTYCQSDLGKLDVLQANKVGSPPADAADAAAGDVMMVDEEHQGRGKSGDTMCKIKMPYACKLLLQELHSMNIRCSIKMRDV